MEHVYTDNDIVERIKTGLSQTIDDLKRERQIIDGKIEQAEISLSNLRYMIERRIINQ